MPFFANYLFWDAFLRYVSLRVAFLRYASLRYAFLSVGFLRDAFLCVSSLRYAFLRDTYMLLFLVFLPFTVVVFFTSFDSVYARFDLTLFTLRLLNFVIDIPL